jgi:hypothetical protein
MSDSRINFTDDLLEFQRADSEFDIELDGIAAQLSPENAAIERALRQRWLINREDRNKIIAEYHRLLAPLRLWSRFLTAIGVPRQTAYDMKAAAERVSCTEFGQFGRQELFRIANKRRRQTYRRARETRKSPLTSQKFVESISSNVERLMARLPDDIRIEAFDQLVERLADLLVAPRSRPPEAQYFQPKLPARLRRAQNLLPWPMAITTGPETLPPESRSQ